MGLRSIFELILCAVLPIVITMILLYASKEHKLSDSLKYKIFAGIILGIVAIFNTELGATVMNGAIVNTRDAAALCAGLCFGLPGGIVAGLIGGIERVLAAFVWGSAGTYTVWACAISTMLCGLVAGILHETLLKKDKKITFLGGFIIGLCGEIVHLGLIALFKLNDIANAMDVIRSLAIPQIICNALAVGLTILFLNRLNKES